MKENYEIEFKNLLTKEEYERLLHYFHKDNKNFFHQFNVYFDNKNMDLKNMNSALRIRIEDNNAEITLKVPYKNHLMEYNQDISMAQAQTIIDKGIMNLPKNMMDVVENLKLNDTTFEKTFSFKTKRVEKSIDTHLIVLDECTFDQSIDYELEIESTDEGRGLAYFENILEQFSIPKRPTLPKIARAAEAHYRFFE